MVLKNQVCGLKSAKKLKKLGVKQKSLFYWSKDENSDNPKEKWKLIFIRKGRGSMCDWITYYSAFTFAELDEIISAKKMVITAGLYFGFLSRSKTKTEATAKMLIDFLENKHEKD